MPDQKPTLDYATGKKRSWQLFVVTLAVVAALFVVVLIYLTGAYLSGFSEAEP